MGRGFGPSAAPGLLRTRRDDLPELVGNPFLVRASIALGIVLVLIAAGLGVSAIVSVMRVFDRAASLARWFVVVPIFLAMAVCFAIYAMLMTAVFIGDELKPAYGELGRSLWRVNVCGDQRLHGRVCQDVLDSCLQERARDAQTCVAIASRHIERIRPRAGPLQ